jgi:hypothetical protein
MTRLLNAGDRVLQYGDHPLPTLSSFFFFALMHHYHLVLSAVGRPRHDFPEAHLAMVIGTILRSPSATCPPIHTLFIQ